MADEPLTFVYLHDFTFYPGGIFDLSHALKKLSLHTRKIN